MTKVFGFRLLQSYISTESSEDLQTKSKKALKNILQKCVYLPALEPLLHDAPSNILKHVVAQYSKVQFCKILRTYWDIFSSWAHPDFLSKNFAKITKIFQVLPNDPSARRLFVTSGGLKKVQEIKAEPGSPLQEHINAINGCFPEEIVRYYSPGYSEALLQRVESFKPSTTMQTSG